MTRRSYKYKLRALRAAKMNEVLKTKKMNKQGQNNAAVEVTKQIECLEMEEDAENSHLHVQVDTSEPPKEPIIEGRRIINLMNFYKKLQEVSRHGPLNCSLGCVEIISEKVNGLQSILTLQCKLCNVKFYVSTDEGSSMNVNNSAVLGTVAIGCGHSQLQELSASLDLPLMGLPMYQKCHDSLGKMWNTISMRSMKNAGEEERKAAMAEGRMDANGVPVIDVIVDGCWSKRTYKKNYSALSGAAAIIGKRTGKVLYVGVKNKYCCICALAVYKNETPREHTCFKNYSGPSTGMESTILVEGFKCSIEMHGLIYGRMISDGDSTTYSKLIETRPYLTHTIQKIECKNHIMRNLCNKISQLKSDTKHPIRFRKYITDKTIIEIRKTIKRAIQKYTSESDEEKRAHVELLYNDIMLAHCHAYGDHSRCKEYFCNKGEEENSSDKEFKTSCLWSKICQIMANVAAHAPSLIHNVESNKSENYNSIIAKLVGGKRINFSLKGSYENRCKGAVIAHNTRALLSTTFKWTTGTSPRGKMKQLERRRMSRKNRRNVYRKKNKFLLCRGEDTNYGEHCAREDISPEMMEEKKKTFLANLKKNKEERDHIQRETILQSASSEWLELRRNLLTASNFGRIFKRREDVSCSNLVKDLLYKGCISHIRSIKHGNDNEKNAIQQLEKEMNIKVEPCGLFIDEKIPYFGASPDGICKDGQIIEIKCPVSAYRLKFEDAIRKKKIPFYKIKDDDTVEINKNHNWYYQIQGQLHITKTEKCLFGLWLGEDIPIRTDLILKDDLFWDRMEPKLSKFYMDCLLPELIDPRFTRKMPIRDPLYIEQAIIEKTQKNTTVKKRKEEKEIFLHKNNDEEKKEDSATNQQVTDFNTDIHLIDDSAIIHTEKISERTKNVYSQLNENTDPNETTDLFINEKSKSQKSMESYYSTNFPKITILSFDELSDDDDEVPEKKRKVLHERQLNLSEF